MAEVIAISLQANIPSSTLNAFRNFDRLVKNIGKTVDSLGRKIGRLSTSLAGLDRGLSRSSGFTNFERRIATAGRAVTSFHKTVLGTNAGILQMSHRMRGLGAVTPVLVALNTSTQNIRRSATQAAMAYRSAAAQLRTLQNLGTRSSAGIKMPTIRFPVINIQAKTVNVTGPGGKGGGGGGGALSGVRGKIMSGSVSATMVGRSVGRFGEGIFGTIRGIFDAGKELETATKQIAGRLLGADKALMTGISESASKIGRAYGVMPSEIMRTNSALLDLGVAPKNLNEASKQSVILSEASRGSMTTEEAGKAYTELLSAQGYRDKFGNIDFKRASNLNSELGTSGKATSLADLVTGVSQNGGGSIEGIIEGMTRSSGWSKGLSISTSEQALMVGAMQASGRTGRAGGLAADRVLQRITSEKGSQAIESDTGINLSQYREKDGSYNFKGITNALAAIKKYAEYSKKTGGNARGMESLKNILGTQGIETVNSLTSALEKSEDTMEKIKANKFAGIADKAAIDNTKDYEHALNKVKAALEPLATKILLLCEGPLKRLSERFIKGIDYVSAWVSAHKPMTLTILKAVAVVGALAIGLGAVLVPLGTLGFAISGIMALFGTAGLAGALGSCLLGLGLLATAIGGFFLLNRLGDWTGLGKFIADGLYGPSIAAMAKVSEGMKTGFGADKVRADTQGMNDPESRKKRDSEIGKLTRIINEAETKVNAGNDENDPELIELQQRIGIWRNNRRNLQYQNDHEGRSGIFDIHGNLKREVGNDVILPQHSNKTTQAGSNTTIHVTVNATTGANAKDIGEQVAYHIKASQDRARSKRQDSYDFDIRNMS